MRSCLEFTPLADAFAPIKDYIAVVRPLENKIEVLQSTAAKLADARQHAIRNKVVALLKTALLVTLLVASILATIYASPSIAGLGFVGLVYYAIGSVYVTLRAWHELLTNKNASSFIPEQNNNGRPIVSEEVEQQPLAKFWAACLLGALFGSLAPIYEAFTRTTALEQAFDQQKKSLEKSREANAIGLSRIVAYYLEKGDAAKVNLTKLDAYHERLLNQRPNDDFRLQKRESEWYLQKIKAVLDFYGKFRRPSGRVSETQSSASQYPSMYPQIT